MAALQLVSMEVIVVGAGLLALYAVFKRPTVNPLQQGTPVTTHMKDYSGIGIPEEWGPIQYWWMPGMVFPPTVANPAIDEMRANPRATPSH